jgi:hypothetical protein
LSEGTLYQVREQCYEALAPIETRIQQAVQQAAVIHSDETGRRVSQLFIKNGSSVIFQPSLTSATFTTS